MTVSLSVACFVERPLTHKPFSPGLGSTIAGIEALLNGGMSIISVFTAR